MAPELANRADERRAVRLGGALVFIVSAFLLTSIGGAGIVASPVTLPLMYVVTRARPSRAFLYAGLIIGTLTAFEGGWGFGFVVLGHADGAAAIVGLCFAAAAAFVFTAVGKGSPVVGAQ